MAVRLLFPNFVFEKNLLDHNLDKRRGVSREYLKQCADAMDGMRRKDPEGRRVSNAYTGWQSNDGCESNPILQQLMRKIEQVFKDEVLPFHGIDQTKASIHIGNSWANINDFSAWNKPHMHNGCWYSGVFYVRADGDEGCIDMVDKDVKVVSDFPHSPRVPMSFSYPPVTGMLILFPSGLMHMVEPNMTDKDRYSISFNMVIKYHSNGAHFGDPKNYHPDEFLFEIDENGDPIMG